jgi:uncharacterized membrane-anchored protein
MDIGQSALFTAAASGGSGTYTAYQWYVDGAAQSGQSSSTFNYSAASAGSYTITATVTDSFSTTSPQSTAATLTVNAGAVAPTLSASKTLVDQGQTSSLSSTAVSTGTSPYSYQWLQKAPDASSYLVVNGATSLSYSFVTSMSTTTGIWSFELQVTDSASTPVIVTSQVVSVTVSVAPTVSVSPGFVALDVGQSQTFTAAASGGSGTYTAYQWYVDGAAQSGQSSSTFNYSAASAGSYTITATVTDSFSTTSPQSTAATLTASTVETTASTPIVTPTPMVSASPTPIITSSPTPIVTPTPLVTAKPTPIITPTPTLGAKSNTIFPIWYLFLFLIPVAIGVALIASKKFWNRPPNDVTIQQSAPVSQAKTGSESSKKQVFICHVAENSRVVEQLVVELEKAGFKAWYYERDNIAGSSYITTDAKAIKNSQAVIVVVSPSSIKSVQVSKEVFYAHDIGKPFFPLLYGMTYEDLKQKQEEWRIAFGTATSVEIRDHDLKSIIPKLIEGLNNIDHRTQ